MKVLTDTIIKQTILVNGRSQATSCVLNMVVTAKSATAIG
jgi:hypothetical protein